MSIKDWPDSMRPREKLLKNGAKSLSDAELLAIFLRTGVQGYSAVELAQQLMINFKGLAGLLRASQAQFCQEFGLGPAKFVQLQAVLEISRRYYQEKLTDLVSLNSSRDTADYLIAQLGDRGYECFMVLYLDNQHQLISTQELFRGTINAANVYPREVVREVIERNAAAVILSHNHPSGICEPSEADRRITSKIQQALRLIDVTVLDHFIIGNNDPYSFADHGLL